MTIRKVWPAFIFVLSLFVFSHPSHGYDGTDIAHGFNSFGICGLKFAPRKLRTASQTVQDADIRWYRCVVRWNEHMDDEGNLDFETLDRQIKIILNHKIKPIMTLRSVHELFAPGSGKIDLGYKKVWRSAPPAPEYLHYYATFVREIVERYDGDGFSDAAFITDRKCVKYWQIECEPGKKPDQGSNYWNGTAADYADLYLFAHDVIKGADLSAQVALCAFTWGALIYYLENSTSFLMEVLRIIDEQGGNIDIFDFHFYKDYKRFFRIDNPLYAHIDGYSQFSLKPLWVTETNIDKNKMDPNFTTEEYNRFVAKDIVKRYSVLFDGYVQKIFWFNFADKANATWNIPMEPNDFEKFRGLTENSFAPKPVYYTYKLLIEKIKGKKAVRRIRALQADTDTWIYKFGRNDIAVYILWYDNPDNQSTEEFIQLPWEQVLITHVITEPGQTEPVTEVRSTPGGILQITLDGSPVFIEKY
jgi:hypothetical protein